MYLYGDYNLICLGIIYRIWIMLGSSALVTVVHGESHKLDTSQKWDTCWKRRSTPKQAK